MSVDDRKLDSLVWKMVAAFEGDTQTWRRVNRALRDAIVDHASAHSPYYREAVRPGMAFEEIPILTKHVVLERFDAFLARGVPERRRFHHRTSGSTGHPMRFVRITQGPAENIASERFFTEYLWKIPRNATMVKVAGRRAATDPATPRAVGLRSRMPPPLRRRPRFHYFSVYDVTSPRMAHELRLWSRRAPYFLVGYPSAFEWMAEIVEHREIEVPVPPEAVVTMSETVTGPLRRRLERTFSCPVHARYSLNELSRIAGSLPGTERYVVNPLLAHVEIVDEAGLPLPPGELGRIVVTDLNNYVMPYIRYDTDDVGRLGEEEYIGGFQVIEEVTGRSSAVLRMPSGKILSAMMLAQSLFMRTDFAFESDIAFYQCAQTGPNELDLRIVWRHEPTEDLRVRVAESLRPTVDPDTIIRVTDIEQLDRLPSGKVWIVRREF